MSNQRGAAMVIALIVAVMLSLLCLSLSLSSLREFSVGTEFENHEKALLVADAGLTRAKQILAGADFSTLLKATTDIPAYLEDTSGVLPYWAKRNPIYLSEARNIDFASPPTAAGTRTVYGYLGSETIGDGGQYFAKVTDNEDEPEGVADDPFTDNDGMVYVRVIGIHRGLPGETTTYGSARKNSVAVIEAEIRQDMTFKLNSPLSIVANDVELSKLSSNAWWIDGNNQCDTGPPQVAGISILSPGGKGEEVRDTIINHLGKRGDQVVGLGPAPSIYDDTQTVLESNNPDAANVLDAGFLQTFVTRIKSLAGDVNEDPKYGSLEKPKIVVIDGNIRLNSGSGAGILVVKGNLELRGNFTYHGLILVIGEGSFSTIGTPNVYGGVLVASVSGGQFNVPSFEGNGNARFDFCGDSISLALSLLPLRTSSWREITPELEPRS
ncbi:MAG TPA: hypothetical protein PLP42_11525 [Acidobacteriota bacterium]|nr:hypothetical protein [Acidobacteriota bacterium]